VPILWKVRGVSVSGLFVVVWVLGMLLRWIFYTVHTLQYRKPEAVTTHI